MAKNKNNKRSGYNEAKETAEEITAQNDYNEKVNTRHRVKLTTMINPNLRDELKAVAKEKRCNLSDVLEYAIKAYLKDVIT